MEPFLSVQGRGKIIMVCHHSKRDAHVFQRPAYCIGVDNSAFIHQHLLFFRLLYRGEGRVCFNALGDNYREYAALAVFAFHAYIPAHGNTEQFGNRKPQSRSFDILPLAYIYLDKLVKEFFLVFRLNPFPGIGNGYPEPDLFIIPLVHGNGQTDMSLFRVLYRVGQEVNEDLAQTHFIADETVGNIRVYIGKEPQRLLHNPCTDNIDRVIDQG